MSFSIISIHNSIQAGIRNAVNVIDHMTTRSELGDMLIAGSVASVVGAHVVSSLPLGIRMITISVGLYIFSLQVHKIYQKGLNTDRQIAQLHRDLEAKDQDLERQAERISELEQRLGILDDSEQA